MTIRVLPPDVAAKIAAGEVVERPASVVKELVENAIDAGAKTVRVEIQGGGKRLIRVMDDGEGIPTEEVPLAFARHATSKLISVDDLSRVTTLGFRGEALASIAAVSQLTLVSRPAAQSAATRIRIEGGQQVGFSAAGSPGGTMITVENLFYNVPARLKFIKADATEAAHIHRVVSHYALAFPHIRFGLLSDNRQTFQTNGSGELFDALVAVFDLETARQMVRVEHKEAGEHPSSGRPKGGSRGAGEISNIAASPLHVSVHGFAGIPALHRGGRDQIILFVNKRWIQDRSLNQAVVQAYHTFLPVGRYPVAALSIELDPAEVDVNVHPTKAEVKFRDPRLVFKVVQKGVREAVMEAAPVPSYGTIQPTSAYGFTPDFGGHAGDTAPWRTSFGGHSGPTSSQFAFDVQRTLPLSPSETAEGLRQPLVEPPISVDKMPLLRVVGQIQQMYIIAEGPDGLYLIDQHAAHERILYEKLTAQRAQAGAARQQLLEPVMVELLPGPAALVEAELDALTEVGFELEPFGGAAYRIRAVPEILGQADPAQALVDILAEMADGAIPLAREIHEKIAITVCKRASIKGGQILSPEEMRELVRQLEATSAPRTCPHGRPTMIHLSTAQLAREFGRM